MAAAILEDRERRNIETAQGFSKRIMDPDLRLGLAGGLRGLDAEGNIKAPDILTTLALYSFILNPSRSVPSFTYPEHSIRLPG